MSAPRRSGPALSVSARLVVAILVPILALSIVGGRVVASRHTDVRRAERLAERLVVVDQLLDLRSALFVERVAAEILVPSRRPPDDVLTATAFGRRILQGGDALARATDDALAALAPADRPFAPERLAAVRADRAEWAGSPDTIRGRLEPLWDDTEALLEAGTAGVRATAVQLGDTDLIAAGTTFQRSIRLPAAAGEIFAALSDLWLSEPGDRARLQSVTAATAATFATSGLSFAQSLVVPGGEVDRFWNGPMQIPAGIAALLDEAQAGSLSSPDRAPGEPASVGVTLLESVDWTIRADELPELTAAGMSAEARRVADEARSAERLAVGLILLAIVLSVAVAVLFGRSIVAPVRRLTTRATRIGAGDLTADALPLRGPPDVAAASAALNDVVATLRLLGDKSQALADVDLEHPSLREQLPGELGASLQRSTEVLSTSIAEREELRAQLLHDATHDSLTGLANRSALRAALAALREPGMSAALPAIVFIDLDGFKQINDRQGHATGDAVLQVTAQRIEGLAPPGSTVARLGGDEFVLLVDGTDPATPEALAHSIVAAVAQPITVNTQTMRVRACAGVAIGDRAGGRLRGPSDLLQRADLAVYHAKQIGGGTVATYDAEFGRRVAQEADIERALSTALTPGSDELRLVFQPIVAAAGGLTSVEALVRWDRRRHGRVLPDSFVPIAERSGLIISLDRWTLHSAIRQLAAWADVPSMRAVPVSVNVSGRTLVHSTFVDDVAATLAEYGVAPQRLIVEVTETAIVTDLGLAGDRLQRLRDRGVRVAIDDFGTGYTSIAHLREMPVDELKIDGSFVHRLPDAGERVLVQMINDVADLLGLRTVAEGVETAEQAEVLRSIGCDALQGYYFSRPLDAGAMARWATDAAAVAAPPGADDQRR